ncbi:MAG: VCBS repeat-containing protein [Burkholderiales bacterium]|nr:VCBS repeat-containing protein [Flavobacterium sp.]
MKNYYFMFIFLGSSSFLSAQGITFTSQTFGGNSSICCVADMNNDFLDDIVTVQSNQMTIYKQKTIGGFDTSIIPFATAVNIPDWSIASGDYDRNGFNDLALGNGSRVTVLKADDTGSNYSIIAYPQNIFTQRTNFIDINNDGNLDLWACHDVNQSHPYRNDGAGNLVFDYSLFPTSSEGGNYATIWIDYDNDGDMDMYEAKCRGGADVNDPKRINLLYRNNGDGTFTDVAPLAGVDDHAQSWSTAVEDFDNDGDLDFLLSNISDQNRMYRNNGDGTFTDIYATTGIAAQVGSWEIQAADFNNDGFVDFLWQNGKELYMNNGNMTFTGYDLPFSEGAIGDLNNDGFLDVQTGNKVYYNSGNPNKWLKVQLQGIESNRNGIGARVEIYGTWGKQIREVRSGQGFSHMSSLNTHFGIGTANAIEKVVVRWPSGTVDTIMNPSSNQALTIVEGSFPLAVNQVANGVCSVYPNPADEVLNVVFNDKSAVVKTAQVFDLSGKQIINTELTNQSLEVKALATGSYVLVLKDAEGKQYTQKFVKK